jgi:hypothetical protein
MPPVWQASGKGVIRQLSSQISSKDVQQEAVNEVNAVSCSLSSALSITIMAADDNATNNTTSSSSSSSSSGRTVQHADLAAAPGQQEPNLQQQQQQQQQQQLTRKDADTAAAFKQQQKQLVCNAQAGDQQLASPFLHKQRSWTFAASVSKAAAQQTSSVNRSITFDQLKAAAASGQAAPLPGSMVQQVTTNYTVTPMNIRCHVVA